MTILKAVIPLNCFGELLEENAFCLLNMRYMYLLALVVFKKTRVS